MKAIVEIKGEIKVARLEDFSTIAS